MGGLSVCVVGVLVSCVHSVAIIRAVFCTICSLSLFVLDALGDHMVEAYSSTGLDMALYVASMVSLGCMLAVAMFMSVCGVVIVMSSAYVVSCTESGGRGMSQV